MAKRWCFAGLFCFAALWTQAQTTGTAVSPAVRTERWQEDLTFLVSGLGAHGHTADGVTRGQKDFGRLYPRASFNAAIRSLEADIPNISDEEIVLRLVRLWAGANVSHNVVRFPSGMGFSTRLPLNFNWYSDGLAVDATAPEYSAAIGARVVKIGGMTPDQLLSAVTPYISHENDACLRDVAPDFISREAVLRHLGLLGQNGGVAITVEKAGAPQFTMSVTPSDPETKQVTFFDALHVPTPLCRSRPGKRYWYQRLEDSQTLYIQYNECDDDPQLKFADFSKQVLAEADAHPVKRVIIDLRWNPGGNSKVIDPLKSGLASRLNSIQHVYVLIGPHTYSSALMNAMQLRDDLKATLVGDPTGEPPNMYGEVRVLVLPNSKIAVQYTTKFFRPEKHGTASALQPDILVPRTLADALAGRDAALETAIAAP